MLKDSSTFNIPNPSIEKGTICKKLIEFIERTLCIFQRDFRGNKNTSEEVLSEHLAKTFDYYSKPLAFIFQKEVIQIQSKGHNRKVDIGVFNLYTDDEPFFTLEAKRLPTLLKYREKEYVIGNDDIKPTGGIERFKYNLHGKNLFESAMIAYVQEGDFKEWQNKINNWIEELIEDTNNLELYWSSEDLLKNTCDFKDHRISKFISNNAKVNKTSIKLFHYFINMMN